MSNHNAKSPAAATGEPALLERRFGGLTDQIGFLEAPLDRVRDAIVASHRKRGREVSTDAVSEPLESSLARVLPAAHQPTRELIVENEGGWVAYFNNVPGGTDAGSAVGHLTALHEWRGLLVTSVPHTYAAETRSGEMGAQMFSVYAEREPRGALTNCVRNVVVMHDGRRWRFEQHGAPLPFEDPARYEARRVTTRLTPHMLADYFAALGVRLFDATAYGPKGYLISSSRTSAGRSDA